jgi:soluble lytic murein transglycosylase
MGKKILKEGFLAALILGAVFFTTPPPIFADIYMYVDGEGVTHFTNIPNSRNYKLFLRERSSRDVSSDRSESQLNRYDSHIRLASKTHGVDFHLLKAIIKVESDFDSRAVSEKGAVGLMQIMPENFSLLNLKNPYDPGQNIMAGTRYFRGLLDQFGELKLALAAYNSGPGLVERLGSIPRIPETEEYVRRVMKYYAYFKE